MTEVPLVNQTSVALIDDEDAEKVLKHRWYLTPKGYVMTRIGHWRDGVTLYLHRFVMNATKDDPDVDHRHGDKLDNRKSELRMATRLTQQINRHKHHGTNRSGTRGVSWYAKAGKWRARIKYDAKAIHLGLFSTKEAAIEARKKAELKYFGEHCPAIPERLLEQRAEQRPLHREAAK